jgi:radical SAM superfamily enzyme YgiQ (UPF0313 family)
MNRFDKPRVSLVIPKLYFDAYKVFAPVAIGPVLLATILQQKGYNARVYDESRTPLFKRGKLRKEIAESDFVGAYIISPAAERGYMILEQARKQNPRVKTGLGGAHASLLPQEARQHADVIVVGEAEGAIEGVVNRLEGVVQGGRVENLDELPIANLNLVEGYEHRLLRERFLGRVIPISSARGCPNLCSFCSVPLISGRKIRSMSAERMFYEVEQRVAEGYRVFFITDDNYSIGRQKQVRREFHERIARNGLGKKISLTIQDEAVMYKTPQREVDSDYLDSMRDAGVRRVMIGIETINPEARKEAGKRGKLEDVMGCVGELQKRGINVHAFCIVGFPHDNPETIRETVDFCRRLGIKTAQFSTLTPFPGTPLYEEMKGVLRDVAREGWNYYDGLQVMFKHPEMKPEELFRNMQKAWKRFYPWLDTLKSIMKGKVNGAIVNTGGRLAANRIGRLEPV